MRSIRPGRAVPAVLLTVALATLSAAPAAQAESIVPGTPQTIAGPGTVVPKAAPASSQTPSSATTVVAPTRVRKAVSMYGKPRSGLLWHSGIWTGNGMSTANTTTAERWAGRPFDFTTVYPGYNTWDEMSSSGWVTQLMSGYKGRLAYGLPLLPNNRRGQWNDVLSGAHDQVFIQIARDLKAAGRGDAAIRVGLEANGDWFAWGATAATAPKYKKAFQRVVRLMRAQSPRLTFWFDTSAGFGLVGQKHRSDMFTLLYPGDAYVDGISMDHYDFWELQAKTNAQWAKAIKPTKGPGLADAAAFARAHKKGFAVPEWGTHGGLDIPHGGDNAFFVQKMHDFFMANRDILVFECYFNEPASYIRNSLFSPTQMPRAAAKYKALF